MRRHPLYLGVFVSALPSDVPLLDPSLYPDRVLKQLQREGYDVGMLPMDDTALIKTVLNQSEAKYNSAELNIAYRMKVGEHEVVVGAWGLGG